MDAQPTSFNQDIFAITRMLERANQIAATTQLDQLLTQMLSLSMEVSGAQAGICYLIDQEAYLTARSVRGLPFCKQALGRKLSSESNLACRCMSTGRAATYNLEGEDLSGLIDTQALQGIPLINTVVVPIPRQVYPNGVLQLFNLNLETRDLLQILCDRMASEIQKLLLLNLSEERTRRLQSMVGFLGRIDSSLDPQQILETLIEDASKLLNVEVSSLFLADENTNDLVLQISSREDHLREEPLRVPPGQGIIGYVVKTGETVLVNDTSIDRRHYKDIDQSTEFITRSLVAVPLCSRPIQLVNGRRISSERIIGGLEAVNKINGNFDAVDLSLLQSFANQAATVLQIANLYKEADELFLDAIRALTAAIDAKDPYTKGHSQRVSDISVAIAHELDMDSEFVHRVRIGSMLHDVGKLGIPDNILCKPDILTADEYNTMKTHPEVGERVLRKVHTLHSELAAVLEHHERLDGSGYPLGLKGGEISMTGRIVAVADAFDAMTSDRPYRKAMSFDEAIRQLLSSTDKYDSRCVQALIHVYQNQSLRSLFEQNPSTNVQKSHKSSSWAIAD